ncbi:anti-repressor SinI family protein [Metabacillus sp. SLBN-84]
MTDKQENQLPEEWVELVKEAMNSDVTKEEFKKFLEEKSKEKK